MGDLGQPRGDKVLKEEVSKEVLTKSYQGSRYSEYPWVFKKLVEPPSRVLDVGCISSYFCFGLLKLGYEVHGIDTRWNSDLYWERYVHPETFRLWEENRTTNRVKFKLGDIRNTDYPDHFFDQVLAISTIEHIGLAAYGNPADDKEDGDFKAMREISRIVKPGGNILITIPYGDHDWRKLGIQARIYNDSRLKSFVDGFEVIERKFFAGGYWPEVSKEKAMEINRRDTYGNSAVVCLKLEVGDRA